MQSELSAREQQLRLVQTRLLAARDELVKLENRLRLASAALSSNLVAGYEGSRPDLVSVILDSHGFRDLLEQVSFMQRVGHQDAQIVSSTDRRGRPWRGRPPRWPRSSSATGS